MTGEVGDFASFLTPERRPMVTAAAATVAFVILLVCETARPLRRSIQPKLRRNLRNLVTGGLSAALLAILPTPLLLGAAKSATEHGYGLLNLISLPRWIELLIAILLLDYTLWIWHRANHRLPFLWRFHRVHHVDLDMDASTALRFHFGELILSVPYRALQVVVIGADGRSVWVWQTLLFVSILFHHSNLRLPLKVERWLVRLIVTPRMHGIHHSDRLNEADSNWSSLLSCWDHLHRTLLLNVRQEELDIGVAAYREPSTVTLGKILILPLRTTRGDWLARDGEIARRSDDVTPRTLAP